jgi:hypothetical protein
VLAPFHGACIHMYSDYEVILARSFDWRDVATSVPELFRKQEAWYGGKKMEYVVVLFSAASVLHRQSRRQSEVFAVAGQRNVATDPGKRTG